MGWESWDEAFLEAWGFPYPPPIFDGLHPLPSRERSIARQCHYAAMRAQGWSFSPINNTRKPPPNKRKCFGNAIAPIKIEDQAER